MFLDEIGDMPLALQARSLRVLQERRVAPLGPARSRTSTWRSSAPRTVISSVCSRTALREDLYYRVNGVPLRLPPCASVMTRRLIEGVLDKLGARGVTLDPALTSLLEGLTGRAISANWRWYCAPHWPCARRVSRCSGSIT